MTSRSLGGKVAGIVSERELAINIGYTHGVKEGMKFKVLADQPTELYDPDSNELLGVIDREKIRVKAVDVKEKYTICRTYRTVTVGDFDLGILQARRTVPETLRADKSSYIPPLPEEESYVKRGDKVIQITDEE